MEKNIELDGRKLLKTEVNDFEPNKIKSVSYYDDGTEIAHTVTPEGIDIKCNKQLVIQPDGKTVKIIG